MKRTVFIAILLSFLVVNPKGAFAIEGLIGMFNPALSPDMMVMDHWKALVKEMNGQSFKEGALPAMLMRSRHNMAQTKLLASKEFGFYRQYLAAGLNNSSFERHEFTLRRILINVKADREVFFEKVGLHRSGYLESYALEFPQRRIKFSADALGPVISQGIRPLMSRKMYLNAALLTRSLFDIFAKFRIRIP